MTGTELAEAQWQGTIGTNLLTEELYMSRAVHGLQGITALAVGEYEHVGPKFRPVPAAFPQRSGEQLRSPHFTESSEAHFATDVIFNDEIQRGPTRMPKGRSRGLFLLVK
jgi:hypothetical protein